MLTVILALAGAPGPAVYPEPFAVAVADEFGERLEAAGRDVEKLWELYVWCDSTERGREARTTLMRILRYDKDHRPAREALGHHWHDGQWFTSAKKLAEYEAAEEARRAQEAGLVRFEDRWVAPADLPYLERGLVKDDFGRWLRPEELEKLEAGWIRQDLVWIAPDEVARVEAGLWKCGEEWLTLEAANQHHATPGQWWRIPGDGYVLWTTLDREVAERALGHLNRAMRDLERIYGRRPVDAPRVLLLRDGGQYRRVAGGIQGVVPRCDPRGRAALHYGYFTEGWFDDAAKEYLGMGAAYWDASTEEGESFGPHAARWALGLSFGEAIDRSEATIARLKRAADIDERWLGRYHDEKSIPAWYRYGAASYVERYYEDLVETGGDPWWTRKWAIQNLLRRGPLETLRHVFAMPLDYDSGLERERVLKTIMQAGLVLSFVLDGGCAPVVEKHAQLVAALRDGREATELFTELEQLLAANEAALRAHAGL